MGVPAEGGRAVPVDWLALAGLLALPVAWQADAALGGPLLQPLIAVPLLTLVPGVLLLTLLGLPPRRTLDWGLYAAGTSLVAVMGLGLAANLLSPLVGVAEPLSVGPLVGTLAAFLLALSVALAWTDPDGRRVDVRAVLRAAWRTPATPRALLLLPVAAVLSVAVLNRTGENGPLLAVLLAVAGLLVVVGAGLVERRWQPLALWALALALLYHKSLWTLYGFSGQGNIVSAWLLGRWAPGFGTEGAAASSLLPNVLLYPAYAVASGVDIFTELHVVNPLLVSLIPLACYATFRRYVGGRDAFLGAALVAVAHPFYFQFPTAGRSASPVLFLALFVLAATDTELSPLGANAFALTFAAALVVSHYGSSYFVLLALVGALALLFAARLIADEPMGRPVGDGGAVEIGGFRFGTAAGRWRWITRSFVAFYAVFTLAWYLYTFGGRKFDIIVEHFVGTVQQLYQPQGGGTAARLATDYGALSIRLSKLLYITIAGLVALGLLAAYYDRFRGESSFDDQFVALATMLVGAFGLSFVLSSAWGGGRPMMLTFAVAGVFVVVGAHRIGAVSSRLLALVDDRLGRADESLVRPGVAGLLAVLLVLNTGVAAATVVGGYAPSNVPLQERITTTDDPQVRQIAYDDTDLRANVWLVTHRDRDRGVFADFLMRAKNNDWNRARLVAATDARPDLLVVFFASRNQLEAPDTIPPYVLLGGHNVRMDAFVLNNRETLPMAPLDRELDSRDRIYATSYSAVYYDADAGAP